MKKITVLLICILILSIFSSVLAADEWTKMDVDTSDAEPISCTIVTPLGENAEVKTALGEITADDWSVGPEDAVLTILEYADFECPYCSYAGLTLIDLQKAHPDQIRYVYRHFPLSFHTKALTAAYAADAAGRQGLFFETEHFLYANQDTWSALESPEVFDGWLREQMKTAVEGLDYDQWLIDYDDADLRANIDGAADKVMATGMVNATPTIFLNFNSFNGNYSEENIMKYVNLFDLQKRLYSACPGNLIDETKDYRAVLDTTAGEIVIDLFAEDAPLTVSSIMFLASEGWFDGLSFHRIVPGFVIQTGDPSSTGVGHPGYYTANEANASYSYGEPGMVGMANSGKDKNGSQFFITFDLNQYYTDSLTAENQTAETKKSDADIQAEVQSNLQSMNDAYTIFGKVTDETLPVTEKVDANTVINSITIEEKAK